MGIEYGSGTKIGVAQLVEQGKDILSFKIPVSLVRIQSSILEKLFNNLYMVLLLERPKRLDCGSSRTKVNTWIRIPHNTQNIINIEVGT